MKQRGYTLTELLATVTIMGFLASASLAFHQVGVQRERWDAARDVLRTIFTGEQMYFNLNAAVSYYPPPVATFNNCWGLAGAALTTCRTNWRNNLYTDDPSVRAVGQVDFWVLTTAAPQSFRAVARRVTTLGPPVNGVCITIDALGTVSSAPAPLPAGCSAGWARP